MNMTEEEMICWMCRRTKTDLERDLGSKGNDLISIESSGDRSYYLCFGCRDIIRGIALNAIYNSEEWLTEKAVEEIRSLRFTPKTE